MSNVFRPSFKGVKEGRIFYNPKDFTRSNLVASGTLSGDDQERWLEGDVVLPKTFKTPIWKDDSIKVRFSCSQTFF